MKGNNLVILRGHLGRDPEAHQFPDGNRIAKLRLATTSTWRTDTGERKERTDWHNVDVRGKAADFCLNALQRGAQVFVLGSIRNRVVQDDDGKSRTFSSVVALEVTALNRARDDAKAPAGVSGGGFSGYRGPPAVAAVEPPF